MRDKVNKRKVYLKDWLTTQVQSDLLKLSDEEYFKYAICANEFEHDFNMLVFTYNRDLIDTDEFKETLKLMILAYNQYCVLAIS